MRPKGFLRMMLLPVFVGSLVGSILFTVVLHQKFEFFLLVFGLGFLLSFALFIIVIIVAWIVDSIIFSSQR